MSARGPGRPPIGPAALVVTTVRVPPPLLTSYEVEARRRGVSVGSLIREVLERGAVCRFPIHDPNRDPRLG